MGWELLVGKAVPGVRLCLCFLCSLYNLLTLGTPTSLHALVSYLHVACMYLYLNCFDCFHTNSHA